MKQTSLNERKDVVWYFYLSEILTSVRENMTMRKGSLTITVGLTALVLAGVSLGTPAEAAKPSYDCAKARLADEIAVCGNERLAELDVILTFGFTYLKRHMGKEPTFKLAKAFLKERQACQDNMECIRGAYIAANLEYQKNGAPILVPEWGFRPIGRNPVIIQGGLGDTASADIRAVAEGSTAAQSTQAAPAAPAPQGSVPLALNTAAPEASAVTVSTTANSDEDRNRRICHYTMGQMQRFDGKPHSMAECLPDPDAYREKIGEANQKLATVHRITGKSVASLPDNRPLESQMVLWQNEIEAFRLDQAYHSVDAVMTTVDIFDTWGTTLKRFAGTASTAHEKQLLAGLRTAAEARLRQLFPTLRQALGQQLHKKFWHDNVTVEVSGSRSEIITLTGYIYGANRNIATSAEALAPLLKKAHFTEIRFMLDKETSKYKYYKLDAPDDGAIIVWNDSQNYEAVF